MAFNTSRKSIDRMRQRYAASGDVKDLPRSGRPGVTSHAEDRVITNTTLRNRFTDHADSTTTRCWRHNRLFKPSGTESMQLGSSHMFLLRSPLFFRGTKQLAFSLLVITSDGTDKVANCHVLRWEPVLSTSYWRATMCLASKRGASRRSQHVATPCL